MAYKKYNLNGREMLNLDNQGMVDYDEYYTISRRSYERRKNITDKYELSINHSIPFSEELKSLNPEMYNNYKDCFKELNEEENMYNDEKQQLLSKGYPFDKKLKMYGYYIIKIDNNYFQYKLVDLEKNVKIDMGDKLLPQNVNISSYEFVPITVEELQEIKRKVLKNIPAARYRKNKQNNVEASQGLFEENMTRKSK